MFACDDGSRWYHNMGLLELEKLFADGGNTWYLRTGKKYIVNVKKIRADKVSDACDLYFDAIEEPLINAVSHGDYLDAYYECPYIIQR